jgi:DNA-binding IclR family transcriptional regulator
MPKKEPISPPSPRAVKPVRAEKASRSARHPREATSLLPEDMEEDTGDRVVQGAQSLRRAVAILRVVSQWGDRGCRPKFVAEQTGLNLATADRLLRVMADERMLERFGPDRLYRIGPEIVFLAAVRGQQFSLGAHYDAALRDLTDRIKETCYLWLRVGDQATCLARYETDEFIRVLSGDVGVRLPLGVGAGTLGILAFMPDEEMRATVRRNRRLYGAYDLTAEEVIEAVAVARRLGYGFKEDYFVPEVVSLSLPVTDKNGVVLGSIGIITFRSKLTPDIRAEYLAGLHHVLDSVPPPND